MDEETWDGPKLAHEADPEEDLDFDKLGQDADDEDEEDDDPDSEEFEVQLSPSDERLLEELLRMKLTSLPQSPGSSSEVMRGKMSSLLPKTNLEQFEDIIFESQLFEAALPNLGAAVASNGQFESVGFDFEASDAIFNDEFVIESNENDDSCDCTTCKERMRHKEELQRLKETWAEVRDSMESVYGYMVMNEMKTTFDSLDLNELKEKVRQLLWRDPHQLFQRLEAIVKDVVLEQKVALIKLLKHEAKSPTLAQNFIQSLLDGYERLCNACQHLSPVIMELENEHLSRFSLTWELLNKFLHQSTIYSDPIIQTNVPIFISQLRSLYSDKEHEGKYTELVRGFLDFDVEMSNIVPLWSNSEKLLNEYNKQQAQLRAKQKMLKEDWEKFKAQRRDLKIQMDQDCNKEPKSTSLMEGLKKCPTFGEPSEVPTNGKICTSSSASKLAEVFPSLLTAEGKKSPEPAAPLSRPANPPVESSEAETVILAENLEEKLKFEHEDEDDEDECCTGHCTKAMEEEIQKLEISQPTTTLPAAATNNPSSTPCNNPTGAPVPPPKKATTAKELRDLMYQHYSVGKGKLKKPSANAIKKGKVPPPPCNANKTTQHSKAHDESTDEMSEESDDEDNDTCCSETSKGTTTTASESHGKNHGNCACCYCEVFGSGGQSVAPVSRNYPEMRERLRLLLSKKKRKNQGQPPPPPPPKTRPPPPRASSASSSASSNLLSSRSESKVKQPSVPRQQTTPPAEEETEPKDEKALDELLDFIEGNQKNSNEKKKAKKERQKQKKIEEIRKKEDEERRQKAALEAERKRREEEARRADEAARMLDKKRKKKEAQRLKKLAAKGIDPPPMESPTSEGSVSSLAALEELKAKHMRELQELQIQHQKQLEEEARRLKLKELPKSQSASAIPNGNAVNSNSKASTQIKITRTPSGGVEFTTVPANGAPASGPEPSQASMTTPPSQNPTSSPKPSIPSKTGAPMVTIRRIDNPQSGDPMVTISMAKDKKQKEDKLLYTLVNGQAMRTNEAPQDLIPSAKLMDKKQKKKLNKKPAPNEAPPPVIQQQHQYQQPNTLPMQHQNPYQQQAPTGRAPLPLDQTGRVDLERLQLPPGISITRLSGAAPDRKYFPATTEEYSNRDQSVLPLPGTVSKSPNVDYAAMEGMPSGLSGPNVIVVDTANLKTREEEEKEKKGVKKKKKNKGKSDNSQDALAKSASMGVMPSYITPQQQQSTSQHQPDVPPQPSNNNLKSGPQVLIKNVNGKVTITPVPDAAGATPVDNNGIIPPKSKPNKKSLNNINDVQKSHSVPNVNGHVQDANGDPRKFSFSNNDGDDPDKVFAPSHDIDMDKVDDSDRVVEQYKRFLAGFPSPSPDQPRVRPKVELDLKNIFKKKPQFSNGITSTEAN